MKENNKLKEKITKIINDSNIYNRETGEWGYDNSKAINDVYDFVLDITEQLNIEDYARFCIACDRKGLKPIIYKDFINL